MAKKVQAYIKLQVKAAQANPSPPVGPALGQHGVNIGQFVKQFNDETRAQAGLIIPVIITVYKDRTFTLQYKSPPAAVLLKRSAKIASAAKAPGVPLRKITPSCTMYARSVILSVSRTLWSVTSTPMPRDLR